MYLTTNEGLKLNLVKLGKRYGGTILLLSADPISKEKEDELTEEYKGAFHSAICVKSGIIE